MGGSALPVGPGRQVVQEQGSDETELFLDLLEAQRCLWDPADRSYKNRVQMKQSCF